jgi:hypothetical protein
VTCRIAPHHFESIALFLDETRRVLKRDGTLALVDNVVPAGSVGDYINAFERFRDPSHLRAWTAEEWRDALQQHGFAIAHEELLSKIWTSPTGGSPRSGDEGLSARTARARNTRRAERPAANQKNGALTFRLSERCSSRGPRRTVRTPRTRDRSQRCASSARSPLRCC